MAQLCYNKASKTLTDNKERGILKIFSICKRIETNNLVGLKGRIREFLPNGQQANFGEFVGGGGGGCSVNIKNHT